MKHVNSLKIIHLQTKPVLKKVSLMWIESERQDAYHPFYLIQRVND